MCCSQRSSLSVTMSVWNAQTSAIMLLGFLNISYAWHGNLAGQVAFPVAVLHLLVQGRPMLLFLLSWLIITKVMT